MSEAFPGNIVSFDYATRPISASATIDYTSVSSTASIQSGNTTAEIFVDIINDASIEGDEVFEVKISNPVNTIISNELALGVIKGELPSLFIADATALENAGRIKFVVTLSQPLSKTLSFDYRTIDTGSASADLDYTSVSSGKASRATIDIGDTTAEIFINIINDASVEDDETFYLAISSTQNISISRAQATATIKIDELPSLAITDATALEGAGSIKFLVSLSEAFAGNIVSFNYRIIAGSASADLDYLPYPRTVSINAGDTTTELSIAIINDTLIEDDETLFVVITNPLNATINENRASATGTIKIDDLPMLTIADATALESDSSIKFTVSLSEAFPGNDVSFDYHTIAGSAIAGDDYTAVFDTTSISAGDTTAEIFIYIINDTLVEDDETFALVIANPHNATITKDRGTATIKIDDLPSLSIKDATTLESAGRIKFTVSLSEVFPGNLVSLSYETMPSSASADLDYASSVGTASISAGEATTEIVIKIVNDTLIEDDETFFVKISNPINATIDENRARATATIKIDDLPSLAIANATAADNAELIKFTVSLSEAFVGNPVFFDYATRPISASADIDYTSVSSTTSISAGDTTTEIVIELIDDTNTEGDEGDEVFEVKISNPVNHPVRATISKELALGVIKGELASLFIADATTLENAGRIKFVVTLSQLQPETVVSFDYHTIAGSASATIDYTSSVGTAIINAGETNTEILIDIINDASVEDDEIFYLAISSTQSNIPISRARATATIKIDDIPSLTIADATAFEDAGRIKFTASLSEAFPGNLVSFDYETIPISASAHLDYTPFSNRISIAAGETKTEIFIDIINDAIIEDDETFALVIANPHNASITRDRATATIKINDLSLSIADASAFENEGSIKLTVSLSAPFPSNKAVVFNYHTLDIASAIAGVDYTSVIAGRATIAAGETSTEIVIELSDDSEVEDEESFLVVISPNQLDIPIKRASATATIKIDDLPSLSIAGSSAAEENKEGSISFLVTLSEAFPGNDVSFDYHTIPSSASTQDYTSVASSRASIQAGELTTNIVIDISNDSLPEDDETFMVIISNPYNATIDKNRASAIGTIKINDLSLSIADSSVKENVGSIKLTVSLSAPFPSSKAVVFNYRTLETTSANSASSGDDYTSVVAGRATINIDDTTTEIVIDLSDDSIIEDDETFLVIISTNQLDIPIKRASATATIKIDDLPSLSIAGSSAEEENEDGSISFLVTLSEAFPGNDVSFDYHTIPISASTQDYTSVVAGRASIQASYTATKIVIDISDDTLVEDAETFLVVISSPYNATIDISQATGTIKISDLSLSIADSSVKENVGSIKFTVSLSALFPSSKDVVFNYHTIDTGSAIAGADYTSIISGRATIDIGKTSTEIMIDISDDSIVEDIETFLVEISSPQPNIPISIARAKASIKIDDLPSLSIAGSSAAEKDGTISFLVTLSEAFPGNDVSFDYKTIEIADSASADTDYTSKAGRATIASGELTTSIFINLNDDSLVEDIETFLVEISNPHNATIDKNRARAIGTIEIDDKPILSITGSSASESAGSIKFRVSLSEAFPGNDVSFDYRTIAGSAMADIDYTSTSDTTSIKAGDTTAEIFIKITQDIYEESDEVFSVEISNPTNASIGKGLASGFITGEIPILFITGGSAKESAGSIKFLVTLSRKIEKDVSFDYETRDTGSASADLDYTSINARATISSGSTTTDILIGIITDASTEDAETFIVEISNPSNATIDISQATGTIKINGLSLSIADASAFEDAGSIKLRVSLSEPFPSRKAVAFNYRTQDTGSPNSAIAGADYTSVVTGRATIDIGQTSTEIMIDIIDDSIVEDIESFLVVISPNQLDIPISRASATASIKIDDLPSLSIAGSSVAENAGIVTFTASLSESFPHNTDVSFDYQTKKGSANNKIVWQQALATTTSPERWAARDSHQTVVFKNRMWVLGGSDGSDKNDVWYSSNGKSWAMATASAGWRARSGHRALVFKNRMWVLGGFEGDDPKNDVWDSTNGADWNEVKADNDVAWRGGSHHTSVVYNNKMWVIGDGRTKRVWNSTNGADWHPVTSNAAWTARSSQSSVVFDGKMWLLGGQSEGFASFKNDVWYSTNGVDWYPATTNVPWSKRIRYTAVVFDGKMWVLGGQGIGEKRQNDVYYSSNGADWSRLATESSWEARYGHSSVVFDDKIWVLGGSVSPRKNDIHFAYAAGDYLSASSTGTILGGARSTTIDITLLDDDILELTDESFDIIISQPINATIDAISGDNQATASILADTASWARATSDAGWEARSSHSSVVFDNKIWVLGGSSSGSNTSDVWYSSNGINWARATTNAGWEARSSQSSVVFDDEIWVLGNSNWWSSQNGVAWTKSTEKKSWEARSGQSLIVFRNEVWLLGGSDAGALKNDVWNYATEADFNIFFIVTAWRKLKADDDDNNSWSARQNHSSVAYKGKVWILGGNDGSYKNDVWYSTDGISWAEATTDANWEARSEHSSVVFDNKMWVLGGSDGSDKNDVWYSTDGKNWSEVTTSSIWDARDAHSSVVFRDKIWVLGGKDNIANKNDVWFLSELDEQ